MRLFRGMGLFAGAALLALLVILPGMARAESSIVLSIISPVSGQPEYKVTAVNAGEDTPTVYFGDNRNLITARVTGKKEAGAEVKAGDRIMAVLPVGLSYMKAPDAENFRDYVAWPENVDGVKNIIQDVKFIAGTPRSLTVEIGGVEGAGGAVALDFLYGKKDFSSVRVAPFIEKIEHFEADSGGSVTRAEFFDLLAENNLPFATSPLNFADSGKKLAERFSDTSSMTPSQLGNATFLADSGLIAGCGGGRLAPEEYITRAEAVHLVGKIFPPADKKAAFSDPIPGWATGVDTAAARGIAAGYPDGAFRPGEYITRQEVITLLQRMLESFGSGEN